MANDNNLIPFTELTEEEQRETARKGGIASGEARRKKKQLKQLASIILNNNIQDERQVEQIRKQLPYLNDEDVTWGLILLLKQFEKAKDGDAKAFELLRDTSGQKPEEKQTIGFADTDRIEVKIDGEDVENTDEDIK